MFISEKVFIESVFFYSSRRVEFVCTCTRLRRRSSEIGLDYERKTQSDRRVDSESRDKLREILIGC